MSQKEPRNDAEDIIKSDRVINEKLMQIQIQKDQEKLALERQEEARLRKEQQERLEKQRIQEKQRLERAEQERRRLIKENFDKDFPDIDITREIPKCCYTCQNLLRSVPKKEIEDLFMNPEIANYTFAFSIKSNNKTFLNLCKLSLPGQTYMIPIGDPKPSLCTKYQLSTIILQERGRVRKIEEEKALEEQKQLRILQEKRARYREAKNVVDNFEKTEVE